MGLLQNMGVNSIRVYSGIPKKWIEYIYENYGIYTMLNHSFGRYGLTIDGVWKPNTEYSDAKTRELLGVVSDQVGGPTYAGDIAKAILRIIEKIATKNETTPTTTMKIENIKIPVSDPNTHEFHQSVLF